MLQTCLGKLCHARRVNFRFALVVSLVSLACASSSCAGARDPDTGRPRANEPPYPVVLAANAERREQALAGWAALARDNNLQNEPPPQLQPVTATISALP
ncbi:MAG TPA: hypothetical protein VGB76_01600, partial [Pyrinomonadaceae bacterium]